MKKKKIVSTALAGALIAAQMAMPVMAADGGDFTVTVDTKTPVIRVVVPTSMEIAVNQFGMGDAGSQIYSNAFEMENKSQIPVKVSVTSTATLGANTKLLATKAAAGSSTKAGEAWLAAAAQTAANSYADGSTAFADLTESNKNVATFSQGSGTTGTASQTFYLKESSTMAYKLLAANEDATDITYAQFYLLSPITLTGADKNAKDAEVEAVVEEKDVYYVVTANVANEGEAVQVIAKGTTSPTIDTDTNTYYTASMTAADKTDVNNTTHSGLYVYGDGTTDADGKAAFRYIGKLSGAQESWTNTDIATVKVAYTITGVETAKYTTYAAACTYGLYPTLAVVSGATTIASPASDGAGYAVALTNGTNSVIEFALGDGMSIKKVYANGDPTNLTTENSALVTSSGNKVTLLGNSSWASSAAGTVKYIKVVVDKGNQTTMDFIFKVTCN